MNRLYLSLLFVVLVMGVAGWVFWRYFYLASVSIDPLPSEATISVDGKTVPDRTLRLPRGDYKIEISAPGYRSQQFIAKVSYGSQINRRVELEALPSPKKLLDGPLASLAPTPDRKAVFFAKKGVLHQYSLAIPPEGAPAPPAVPITPLLTGITAIDWADDFNLAIFYKKGELLLYDFNRYDLLHQEQRALDTTYTDTAWASDGSGFYAIKQVPNGEYSLVKANRAGEGVTRLLDLTGFPIKKLSILAGPPNLLILSSAEAKRPGDSEASAVADIYLFDAFQRLPPAPITESGRASAPVLSPDRTKIAYLDSGELVTADITGKNKRNTGLRPRAFNYSFADSNKLMVLTANQVSLFSLADGVKTELEVYAPSEVVSDFMANPDGETVYYVYQGDLYRLNSQSQPPKQ